MRVANVGCELSDRGEAVGAVAGEGVEVEYWHLARTFVSVVL